MTTPVDHAMAAHQRRRSLLFFNHLTRQAEADTVNGFTFHLTDGSKVTAGNLLGVDSSEAKVACRDVVIENPQVAAIRLSQPVVLRGGDIRYFRVSLHPPKATMTPAAELDY